MCLDVEYYGDTYSGIYIEEYIGGTNPKFKTKYENRSNVTQCNDFKKGKFRNILNLDPNDKKIIDGVIYINIVNKEGLTFTALYSGNNVDKVMNSTWYTYLGRNNNVECIQTGSYNGEGFRKCLHHVDFEIKNGEVIDHINNNPLDNRIDNLRKVTNSSNSRNKNTNNKYGLVGLQKRREKWISSFTYNNYLIYTESKANLQDAKIDNLIAQKYLGYKHNEEMFYLLNSLTEERVKKTTGTLDRKIQAIKNLSIVEKEYSHDIEKIEGGYKLKKNGKEMLFDCSLDFIKNKFIWNSDIYWCFHTFKDGEKTNHTFHKALLELKPNEYIDYGVCVDHLNNDTNDNRIGNLVIATPYSNACNKVGQGYFKTEYNNFRVIYMRNYKYWKLIGGVKSPTFKTEQEAIKEIQRRKNIIQNARVKLRSKRDLDSLIRYCLKNGHLQSNGLADLDLGYLYYKHSLKTLFNNNY